MSVLSLMMTFVIFCVLWQNAAANFPSQTANLPSQTANFREPPVNNFLRYPHESHQQLKRSPDTFRGVKEV